MTDININTSDIQKRRRRPFSSTEKTIMCNMYHSFKNETPSASHNDICKTIASSMGVHWVSIYKVVKEQKINNGVFNTTKKKRNRISIVDKIDDFEKSAIRVKVHNFFSRNEIPTLDKLLKAVNDDETLGNYKRSTLSKLLKNIGFKYNKKNRNCMLIDRDDIFSCSVDSDGESNNTSHIEVSSHTDKLHSEHSMQAKINENVLCPSDESDSLIEDPEEPEEDSTSTREVDPKELHILKCKECSEVIRGFRYACVQCSDWDMCGGCEARGEHPHHYVLRVPELHDQKKVASMLEVLQKQLKILLDEIEDLSNSEDEVEIKLEYGELEPDPLNQDVQEESVVPQFTPLTFKRESNEHHEEAPSLTECTFVTVSQGICDQENAAEKPNRPIFIENQSNKLKSNTAIKVVPPDDNEARKQTHLDESQPGTSANK